MPSPFPGMDPFIEDKSIWSDFHTDLAGEIRAVLNKHIQPKYYATAVTYFTYDVIEVTQSQLRSASPDVGVWRTVGNPAPNLGTALIDPPLVHSTVKLETPVRLSNVEVRMSSGNILVTAIEILSPINKKKGADREKYLRKRRELLRSEVNLMEVDLLRGGHRTPLETPVPMAAYYVTLCRANALPQVDVWPIELNQRLPIVPVPLIAPDADAPLDLGIIVQGIYERGGYATRIDYRRPVPPPSLQPHDEAWTRKLLAG